MGVRASRSLLFFSLSLLFYLPKSTSADDDDNGSYYLQKFCSNTTFAPNSIYQGNLNTVFHSLSSSNATAAGNGTKDAVHGLFFCNGYNDNATACHLCVASATTTNLPKACPLRKGAVIWLNQCMVRYSNEPLLGRMESEPDTNLMGGDNIWGNWTRFLELLRSTMSDLAVQAAAGDRSGRKLATKEANITSLGLTLYTLAQCTPDLSGGDCERCLGIATGMLNMAKTGGEIMLPSCVVGFDTSPLTIDVAKPNSTGDSG